MESSFVGAVSVWTCAQQLSFEKAPSCKSSLQDRLIFFLQVRMSMFAAYVLGRLGSPMNNVAISFRADLLSVEIIDTNHPSGIFTDAGPDDLMKARSAVEPSCKIYPLSHPYAVDDLRSPV